MRRAIGWLMVVVLLLGAWVAAGPYLTVRAIRSAVEAQDAAALSREVDFPQLRGSLKGQLEDRLARAADADAGANPLAAWGLSLASGVVDGLVDTMVTPYGLGALMEGRRIWQRVDHGFSAPADPTTPPAPPLQDAHYRYESASRFTATMRDTRGRPIVFVLTRSGLRWRLSDVRLPR